MPRVKNISGGQLDVGTLGRFVEDGEVIDAPDYQPGHGPDHCDECQPGRAMTYAWPSNRWKIITDDSEPVTVTPATDEADE